MASNIISGDKIVPRNTLSAQVDFDEFTGNIDGVRDPIARVARVFARLAAALVDVVTLKALAVEDLTNQIAKINDLMRTFNSELKGLSAAKDTDPEQIVVGDKEAAAMREYLLSLGFKEGSTNDQKDTDFSYSLHRFSPTQAEIQAALASGGTTAYGLLLQRYAAMPEVYQIVMTKAQLTAANNNLQLIVDDKGAQSSQRNTELQSATNRLNSAVEATSAASKKHATQGTEIAHSIKVGG
jgi:hypothetical protein